jgi:metal-sulfur cluster biosynthetic enzyme
MVDILTLELIRGVTIDDKGVVDVKLTLTTPTCPYGDVILTAVKSGVERVQGVRQANVHLTWEPQWSPSDELRVHLGLF